MTRFKAGQKVWLNPSKLPLYVAYYGDGVKGALEVLEVNGDAAIVRCGTVTLPLPVSTKWLMVHAADWDPDAASEDRHAA